MEGLFHLYSKAQITYFKVCGKIEKVKVLEVFKRKAIVGMQVFKDSCTMLIKLSSARSTSFVDMRVELARVEAQHKKLRAEIADV